MSFDRIIQFFKNGNNAVSTVKKKNKKLGNKRK